MIAYNSLFFLEYSNCSVYFDVKKISTDLNIFEAYFELKLASARGISESPF
jgi:hypothetical protein